MSSEFTPIPISLSKIASVVAAPTAGNSPLAAVRLFLTRLLHSFQRALSLRRPWTELVDRSSISRPNSLSDATSRVRRNLHYFRVNYLAVIAFVLAVSLLSHPFSLLILISLVGGWLFLFVFRPADEPIVIFNRTFSRGEILGVLSLLTLLVIFLTSVGSLLMSATLIGVGIVLVHGAFRDPEDLFLDEQDLPGSGVLSLLSRGGTASSAAANGIISSAV